MRTINRNPISVKQLDYNDINYKFFTQANWKGLNEDENVVTVDPETFADAENVYINEDGILKSRPSIERESNILTKSKVWVFGKYCVYKSKRGNNIDCIYVSNGLLTNDKYYDTTANITYAIELVNAIWLFLDNNKIVQYCKEDDNFYDQDNIYIPTTKIFQNNLQLESSEEENELTTKNITKYNYIKDKDLKINDYLNYYIQNGKNTSSTNIIINKSEDNELTVAGPFDENSFVEMAVKGSSNVSDIFYDSTYDTKYVLYNEDKNILVKGKLNANKLSISCSFDFGNNWKLLPEITVSHTLSEKIVNMVLSEDGSTMFVIGDEDARTVYAISILPMETGLLRFENWTNILEYWKYTLSVPVLEMQLVYAKSDTSFAIAFKQNVEPGNEYRLIICDVNDENKIKYYTGIESICILYYDNLTNYMYASYLSDDLFILGNTANKQIVNPSTDYQLSNIHIAKYNNEMGFAFTTVTQNKQSVRFISINNNYEIIQENLDYDYFYYLDNKIIQCKKISSENVSGSTIYQIQLKFNDKTVLYDMDKNRNCAVKILSVNDLSFVLLVDSITVDTTKNALYSIKYIKTAEISDLNNGVDNIPLFTHMTELNRVYASFDDTLYISNIGAYYNYAEIKPVKNYWYFPKINTQKFASNITNLHNISTSEVAIFLRNAIYYVSYDTNVNAYRFVKSKIALGCAEGSDVITTFDGKYVIFPSDRGLTVMSYQDFISSTEQSLTFLSDNVFVKFMTWQNSKSVKLIQYKYWIICYINSNDLFVIDTRNNSWWFMKNKLSVKQFIVYDKLIMFSNDDDSYSIGYNKFNTDDNIYYDKLLNNEIQNINWHIKSQRLYLSSINYYKHIVNITLNTALDSNKPALVTIKVKNYRKRADYGKNILGKNKIEDTISFNVDIIRTFVKRLNYYKINAFEYELSNFKNDNDVVDIDAVPLSLTAISIKYLLTGQVR